MTTERGVRKGNRRRIGASRPWPESLRVSLADPREAAAYLNAALEDGYPGVFLAALRQVAEVHGIGSLARRACINREHAYRILSARGNPQLSKLLAILKSLDLKLTICSRAENSD